MSTQVEKLEHNMVKLTVEVSAEEFAKAVKAAYNKNKNKITIPGFRKGHAPQQLIEKLYGPVIFFEEAANALINQTYNEEAESTGLEFVSRPEFDVDQIEKGKPFIYTATVAVRPEVKLGQYRGLEVTRQETLVSDDEINEELKREQEKNSRLVEVDRPVQDGDTVILDYSGSVDGEKFDGGTAENQTLVIGSGSFIPGFEEQLVGMAKDETKDITVTFPEEYHAEELAGKEAVFTCTIHKIQEKELPELDDEFAQDVSEFETLDEYKKSIMDRLTERKQRSAKTRSIRAEAKHPPSVSTGSSGSGSKTGTPFARAVYCSNIFHTAMPGSRPNPREFIQSPAERGVLPCFRKSLRRRDAKSDIVRKASPAPVPLSVIRKKAAINRLPPLS